MVKPYTNFILIKITELFSGLSKIQMEIIVMMFNGNDREKIAQGIKNIVNSIFNKKYKNEKNHVRLCRSSLFQQTD